MSVFLKPQPPPGTSDMAKESDKVTAASQQIHTEVSDDGPAGDGALHLTADGLR